MDCNVMTHVVDIWVKFNLFMPFSFDILQIVISGEPVHNPPMERSLESSGSADNNNEGES